MGRYRIHPAIGVARVGDSPSGYIAPEAWQTDHVPNGAYRDADGKIKRMGVRFRVYEFDRSGVATREITAAEAEITWSVRLANSKAAKTEPMGSGNPLNPQPETLTIDTGLQQVAGAGQDLEVGGHIGPPPGVYVKLGNLRTDVDGRLVVLGGHGVAGSWTASPPPPEAMHNPGWFDDTSDGPVTATVRFDDGGTVEADPAWVLVGPPDYAHPVVNLVTLYDLVADVSVPWATMAQPIPSFRHDVYPLLSRVANLQWTLMSNVAGQFGRTAMHGHGTHGQHELLVGNHEMHRGRGNFLDSRVFPRLHENDPDNPSPSGEELRAYVFERLQDPRTGGGHGPGQMGVPHSMPPVEQLTVTPRQYERLRLWSTGDFDDDWNPNWDPVDPPRAIFEPPFSSLATEDRPAALDRAALTGAVGGPFAPGIEASRVMADPQTYSEPFRISSERMQPGDLTRNLSVPWQAGFNLATANWYPGARPVYVIVKNGNDYTTDYWTRPYTASVPIVPVDVDSLNVYENHESVYANQRMESNQQMVDHWHELGFLARDPNVVDEPMYVETERTLVE